MKRTGLPHGMAAVALGVAYLGLAGCSGGGKQVPLAEAAPVEVAWPDAGSANVPPEAASPADPTRDRVVPDNASPASGETP